MKLTKSLAMTLAVLAMGATANATETIYINGSTAFRVAALQGISAVLGGATPTAQSNATFNSSNAVNWMGVTYNGHTINVKVSFYGAAGGVQTVDQGIKWPFLADNATNATAQAATFIPPVYSNTNPNAAPYTDFQVPVAAFADSYQSTTPYNASTLNDAPVGIVPFQWVASYGAPAGLSLNNHLVNSIFSLGSASLATATGNYTADNAKFLWALGRDADSGTRLIALSESGYGATTAVAQYMPTLGTTSITGHALTAAATINNTPHGTGDGGFASGGNLAKAMRYETFNEITGYYVTYLGKSDATTALSSGTVGAGNAVAVAWNGAQYYAGGGTFNDAAITSGQYTFWSTEHIVTQTLTPGTQAVAFIPALVTAIAGTTATTGTVSYSGINLLAMTVSRSSDGGYVTQNY